MQQLPESFEGAGRERTGSVTDKSGRAASREPKTERSQYARSDFGFFGIVAIEMSGVSIDAKSSVVRRGQSRAM